MLIKRSINFILQKRRDMAGGSYPIRMRISYSGNVVDIPLGFSVKPDDWDAKKQRVKSSHKERQGARYTDINREIDSFRATADEAFARYELISGRIPTPREVKELINDTIGRVGPAGDSDEITFFSVFDEFTATEGQKNGWSVATRKKFATLRNHIADFDPSLRLSEVDSDRMQRLIAHMQERGLRNSTIDKAIKNIKWFLRWASNQGYYEGNAHTAFCPRLKGTDGNAKEIIHLTPSEIDALQEFEGSARLCQVRDVFLFCCFTGLRYSDVAKLTRADIKSDHIRVVTQKTTDGLKIELNKHSKAILDKYKNTKPPSNKALPVISNQKMNDALKELGRLCGIDEPQRIVYFKGSERIEEIYPKWQLLTTHCGRRTFVVNALRLGVPAEVIIRWTGHSDYTAMKPYVKIVDELKRQEMSKFDNLM